MFTIASLPHGTYTFIFKECGYENHRQEYTISDETINRS